MLVSVILLCQNTTLLNNFGVVGVGRCQHAHYVTISHYIITKSYSPFYDFHPIGGINSTGPVIICFAIGLCVYQLLDYDKKKYTSGCSGICERIHVQL